MGDEQNNTPETDADNPTRAAMRQMDELEAYVTAEIDQVRAELDSLSLGFNLTCVCIIALTVLVYLIDKDQA